MNSKRIKRSITNSIIFNIDQCLATSKWTTAELMDMWSYNSCLFVNFLYRIQKCTSYMGLAEEIARANHSSVGGF